MANNIFIPEKIKVGFQKREDTYTKKLAYVIYYDEKGKLRKETSWESWRDNKITPLDLNNEPMSGFVLNKKVGGVGYSSWDARKTYVRVYDPRDFEFEISIPNLLFILENSNSIKGKGLEGDFVYGWSGTELLLVPTSSPDFKQLMNYSKTMHSKDHIKSKELKIGATYTHKKNVNMIYMGRFDKHTVCYNDDETGINRGKHYFFIVKDPREVKTFKSLGDKLIAVADDNCAPDYAELMDSLERCPLYSPVDRSKTEYHPYTLAEFFKQTGNDSYYQDYYVENSGKFYEVTIRDQGNEVVCSYRSYRRLNVRAETFEKLFKMIKPHYRIKHLSNGKAYADSRIYKYSDDVERCEGCNYRYDCNTVWE